MNTQPRRDWLAEYSRSHQHPLNRRLHSIGIPMISLSIAASPLAVVKPSSRKLIVAAFSTGWVLQFIGHAIEGKRPEFFRDPRFLFVGLRWWFEKKRGRA